MATVIITSILTSALVIMCLLFIAAENQRRQKELNTQLLRFSKAGSENGLIFSSQGILVDSIIGLDGIKRKLLVSNREKANPYLIIDLTEVTGCCVQKGNDAGKQFDTELLTKKKKTDSVALQFEFANHRRPLKILFYSSKLYSPYSIKEMEQKAKNWQVMLSKLIRCNCEKIA
jgi:hypothetical protein